MLWLENKTVTSVNYGRPSTNQQTDMRGHREATHFLQYIFMQLKNCDVCCVGIWRISQFFPFLGTVGAACQNDLCLISHALLCPLVGQLPANLQVGFLVILVIRYNLIKFLLRPAGRKLKVGFLVSQLTGSLSVKPTLRQPTG